jgi:hypothetical protein
MNTSGLDGSPKKMGRMAYDAPKFKKKDPVMKPTHPNSPHVMEKTLDKTRKGGYKGANWLK